MEVRWLAFPLYPKTPEEGVSLEKLFAGRDVDISDLSHHLKEVASSLSLPLAVISKIYNGLLAHELAKWAKSQGKGDEFHHMVFKAFFADSKNIANADELVALALSIGFPAEEARDVILSRRFREAVDSDWQRSRMLGITSVPTFIINNQRTIGYQSYEALARFVGDSIAKC